MRNHIFLYVVRREDDPFIGIKEQLSKSNDDIICNIYLSHSEYELVKLVEYSWRRYVRFFFYQKIFDSIVLQLNQTINQKSTNYVYLADEGVWGELLNSFYKNSCDVNFTSINVQHGFFVLNERLDRSKARTFINAISTTIWKYPYFGFGFGKGKFDIYLCYTQKEEEYLKKVGISRVFPCVKLIKKGLINKYHEHKIVQNYDDSCVVFLPTTIPGSGFCSLEVFLDCLKPLIMFLNNNNKKVFLRLHPGGDQKLDLKVIEDSEISSCVTIEKGSNIDTFAKHKVILAANSTALIEGIVLDKISISLGTKCFQDADHYFDSNIDLQSDKWETHLIDLLSPTKIKDTLLYPTFNWLNELNNYDRGCLNK